MAKIKFNPSKEYPINVSRLKGGRQITKEDLESFWAKVPKEYKEAIGIYIFGMIIARGVIPIYVGKTRRSFFSEVFTDRNLNTYNGEIVKRDRDYKPFIQFLVYEKSGRGAINRTVIKRVEKHVITMASEKNPNLANTQNKKIESNFIITGIGSDGRGANTLPGKFFRKMMNY
ncbi:hypothetical protein LEP1GSC050_4154 [Leptospira broomii serovar Hurstbridge str. 5399]|uniref:Uncharacterized protein n=1 Tax=Leptospira broomii serovar Hurstbridge str. 5399 TaxID=1049789 RepID=T0FE14_9LEPT|nr:hypothetical protein [Leptospira broomii]EQA46081.1 hypothetical protein LEP1GSC050_4154 [Leptospira broomii serovar Hurstbridge str. 5399]